MLNHCHLLIITLGIESEYKYVLANMSRSRYNTPAVWTKWNGARSRRRFYRRRGESSPACVVCVCGTRAVGLADYHWALPRISIVLP